MLQLQELLHHLAQPEVQEVALSSGRPAVARVGLEWKALGPSMMTSERIELLLFEAGVGLDAIGSDQPARTLLSPPGVGSLVVMTLKRGDVVQARLIREEAAAAANIPARTSSGSFPSQSAESSSTPARTSSGSFPVPAAESSSAPARTSSGSFAVPAGETSSFEALVSLARSSKCSDLHLISGRPPLFRLAGELMPRGDPLSLARVEQMVMPLVPPRLLPVLERDGSCDFALSHQTAGRFRVNVSRHRGGLKACLRVIPNELPTLESLGLPASLLQATRHHQGLIVITGPSGHGKTSTLTALVDAVNRDTTHHVITVEDPIEFIHPRKKAMMSQREVGTHTRTFQSALKGSLREDPDVIVVGELRDAETVRMALSASETGHLVIATMNTPSAARTIDRLIDLFPPADQAQVRMTLAVGLRMIVSQRLIPTADRKAVVAAAELLPGSISLGNLIREEKTYQIPSLQQRGKSMGIIRLDDSLAQLVYEGKTSLEIATEYAESPEELTRAIKQLAQPAPAASPASPGRRAAL